jgi:hypothetical protein
MRDTSVELRKQDGIELRQQRKLVLAQVVALSFKNGEASESDKKAAAEAACAAGVTTLQYLHARLLWQARLPADDPSEDESIS